MQIKIAKKAPLCTRLEWLKLNRFTIPSDSKNVKQIKLLNPAGKNIKWTISLENE